MARPVTTPPFPDSPGGWLAGYRFRRHLEHGESSPEHLGSILGVSGQTLRRWEANLSRPSDYDIRCFAVACELSPIEEEFLREAFHAQQHEAAPSQEAFALAMNEVMTGEFPSSVLDSLYYIRARNDRALEMFGLPDSWQGLSVFHNIFSEILSETDPRENRRLLGWFRRFWLSTASLCGSDAYRSFIRDLKQIEGFEKRWRNLALTRDDASHQIGGPYAYYRPGVGTFHVTNTTFVLPPVYHIFEYIPIDREAIEWLRRMKDLGPPQIGLNPVWHWSVPSEA
jgi:hypothetical protein